MSTDIDILVSGGGIAGMVAGLVLSKAGFSTLIVDPGPAAENIPATRTDTRTTAFLQPSQRLLSEVGLWPVLAPHATPLQFMAIADLSSAGKISNYRSFDAADVSSEPFGWNLPNHLIRLTLAQALEDEPKATMMNLATTEAMLARESGARVRLGDGTRINAKLVAAADGRNSPLREAAGIGVKTWRYGQKALVFTVRHDQPHNNTSTEVHRSGGPFTLVPLPSLDGEFRSSVVWMESGAEVKRIAALPETDFAQAVNERSGGILGTLVPEDQPRAWPIISQRAERLTGQRLALIAEAAHVVPPIGAQGLNMSLADIRVLRDLAMDHAADLGSDRMLDAFARTRGPNIRARVTGIDALNRASIAGSGLTRDLRGEIMKLFHDITPIRRGLMRAGLGSTQ